MKILLLHSFLVVGLVQSFSVNRSTRTSTMTASRSTSTSLNMNAEVEALLRKAKELREQAESDETRLHTDLINKKKEKDDDKDKIIEELFPPGLSRDNAGIEQVAETMQAKKLSADCLKRVVERLHEREICARGLSHVESSVHQTHVTFEVVADVNEGDLARVEGLITMLIDAASVLDVKMRKKQEEDPSSKHIVDSTHYSSGKLGKVLKEKANFLGREHDDQFKKRSEEYYEAARKKEHVQHKDESSTSMFP